METFNDVIGQMKRLAPFELGYVHRTPQYNLVQQMIGLVEERLQEHEAIVDYLPLDVDENSRTFNTGVLGLANVVNPLAKLYIELFADTRGNRLLLFTEERIIFLVPLDFLEEGRLFSYYFTDIKGITLRKNKQDFLDRRREQAANFLLDFQGANHIFVEMISSDQKEMLLTILQKITKAREIPIGSRIVRKNRFDQVVNNSDIWLGVGKLFNLACFVLVALLVLGLIWGVGPLSYLKVTLF